MNALREMTIHMQKRDTEVIWNTQTIWRIEAHSPIRSSSAAALRHRHHAAHNTKKRDPNLSTLPAILDSKITYKKYQVNRSPFKISGTFHLLIFFDRLLQVIPHISQLDDRAENIILHVQAQSNR